MRFTLLSVLVLSACTSIVPATVMQLNGLSPITADPAGFVIALDMPQGIDIQPGTAQLSFDIRRSDTDERQAGTFVLERTDGARTLFRVAPDDLDALRAIQATAREWEADSDAPTNGSLGLNLSPCKIGDGPAADAKVNVAIRIAEGGPFLPLVRNGPISAVAEVNQIRDIPTCS